MIARHDTAATPIVPGADRTTPARVDQSGRIDTAATRQPAAGVTLPASDATHSVPRAFSAAYAEGDIGHMMQLFASDAVENRGGIDAIAEDYRKLFDDTSARELNLDAVSWSVEPNRIVGSGNFVAVLRPRGHEGERKVAGWIRIEAAPVDGQWKIESLLHGNRR